MIKSAQNVQSLLNEYYTAELNQQEFAQLHHQLSQKLGNVLEKLRQKASTFEERLQQSDQADEHRQQADLLMAHLQSWEPGMKSITLLDFETSKPVTIPLIQRRMLSKMPKRSTSVTRSSNALGMRLSHYSKKCKRKFSI
jgi:predicted ribosome quality control (RQC) complex YloA/Tae2 family protein